MIDIATAIKESISCRQFADYIGLSVNRSGFAVCPFHGEKTASLKIYPDGRGWCCFGCHKGGDVINFASLYYGLDFKSTLQRLNDDFHLGIVLESTETAQNSVLMAVRTARRRIERLKEKRKKEALEAKYWAVFDKWLDAYRRVIKYEPKDFNADWSDEFIKAIKDRAIYNERLTNIEMERIIYDNHQ